MSMTDLEKENTALRQDLTALRSKLPPSTLDGHLTMDEVGEQWGLTASEARAMLDTADIAKDGHNRECVHKDTLDAILLRATGQLRPPTTPAASNLL